MEFFTQLGIDWRLLLAQAINFIILLAVLYKLLYRPVIRLLDERAAKVSRSLKQAEEIEQRLGEVNEQSKQTLALAHRDAERIITEGRAEAEQQRRAGIERTREESERLIAEARERIELEKERMVAEAKAEIADVVVAATEKILTAKLDAAADRALVDRVIRGLEN
ncbi:MAG: F0F1 ATP synthase subunit B [Candidatus Hydrogenedentes bacterium]|nr:F0F1 ATP synthase subunit B [Candidatus Hydrogenedentota bacterium]